MKPAKEELAELIGMDEPLKVKLTDMGRFSAAENANDISYLMREQLNEVCGKFLETLTNPNNGNN